jgi:uncharacterized protein (DUF433 family)
MPAVAAEPVVAPDAAGVLRVAGTRVTLATVVAAFHDGASAEEIALRYEALSLGDVYAALGQYLRNRAELDRALAEHRAASEAARRAVVARQGRQDVRVRLDARVAGGGKSR